MDPLDPLDLTPDPNAAAETITALGRTRTAAEPAPETTTVLRLEVVGGPMDGVTAHVSKGDVVIGRSPTNDLSLRLDPLVSASHARIVREGTSYWLEDLDSRNGTFIGDQRIQERTLIGPGTLFVLGGTCLEFMLG